MRTGRLLWRALIVAPTAIAATYFAFWACAPALTSPEPTPLGAARNGISIGASATSIVGMVPSDCVSGGDLTPSTACLGGDLTVSWRHAMKGGTELGVVLGGGMTRFVTGGVLLRHYLVDTEKVRFGLGVQGGFLWVEAGLPMAFRVSETAWLYLAPTGGLRQHGFARLPVGLTVDVGKAAQVSFEVAAEDFGQRPFATTFEPFVTLGGAVTFRF